MPNEYTALAALERDAWTTFMSGSSLMLVRVKVAAYFDLLNKVSEKASKHESWGNVRRA